MDLTGFAVHAKTEEEKAAETRLLITAVAEPDSEITEQQLPVGASREQIVFPDTLTVTVKQLDAEAVPSEVLSDIRGRDVTLVFDMGNGITWSINGLSITGELDGDIDFGVILGAQAGRSIPVEVRNNVTGERTSLNLTLAYEGEFGFATDLTFTHASDYTIVVDTIPMDGSAESEENTEETAPETVADGTKKALSKE